VRWLQQDMRGGDVSLSHEELAWFGTQYETIAANIERAIQGKRPTIELVVSSLVADGHVLIEDVPGVGKTMLARSLAKSVDLDFKRIQFTPDLLPSDITGNETYLENTQGKSELLFQPGPIFSELVLADEINRAPAKVQSALLEAMQERQVTAGGVRHPLPQPFFVLATQNPIEYEGTFPLPEAQLDRFIMKLPVGYPSQDDEQEILRRRQERRHDTFNLQQVTDADEILAMRQVVEKVHVDPDIERYIVALTSETRKARQVAVGASPRGSLALLKLSRAWAAMKGRDFVLPDDIKIFAIPALIHRLILEPDLWMKRHAADDVISEILRSVPVPVSEGG